MASLENSFISDNEISKIQNLSNLIENNQESVQDDFFQPELIIEQTSIVSESSNISPSSMAKKKSSTKNNVFHFKQLKEKAKARLVEIVKT